MVTSAFVPFPRHSKFFFGGWGRRGILNVTVYDKVGNIKAQPYNNNNNKLYILHVIYMYICMYVYIYIYIYIYI